TRTSMSDQRSFLSVDSYSRSQAAEHMLNSAITQAKISESFEEYLEIFDKFYADDVQVSSETQPEPIRGKARVGSLLLNFLVPLHVMAEIGGLAISIKETAISGDAADEIHSAWTLNIVGVSGKTCRVKPTEPVERDNAVFRVGEPAGESDFEAKPQEV